MKAQRKLVALPSSHPVKLTAERLAEVERAQAKLRECAGLLVGLVEAERNGWLPGSPQVGGHRVKPLEAIARECDEGAETLEVLYS